MRHGRVRCSTRDGYCRRIEIMCECLKCWQTFATCLCHLLLARSQRLVHHRKKLVLIGIYLHVCEDDCHE